MNTDPKPSTPIGRKIRRLRKKKDLSITELAKKVGISRSYLSQIELESVESPTINTMRKISSALDTTVSQLIGEKSRGSKRTKTSYKSPLDKQEIQKLANQSDIDNIVILGDDKDAVETLEIISEILTDPEIPIHKIDKIREKLVTFARFLKFEAKDRKS